LPYPRDFFTAVSHELKTPITVIRGQLESMIMGIGDFKNYEKYLPQVLAATEEMEYLVKEILAIPKMEAMGIEGNMMEISITDIVKECIQSLEPLADEKQITGNVELGDNVQITAQPQLMKKAISNIISNAIRHSPNGENVIIQLTGKSLIVENSGVTIFADDLPNMFTPFYRADKSRNRSSGGSGLGLYIVKTILDLHHLECRMENGMNSVIFTINLNQN